MKAQLAQHLLHDAWDRVRGGERSARPWQWADLSPVARLRAPAHGVDLFVLSDASGRTLAFGPGHHPDTAPPGTAGVTIVSAHRDTHFRFLQYLQPGDRMTLELPDGERVAYQVADADVVDRRTVRFVDDGMTDALLLVTCYPFDAIAPGGDIRYVVTSRRVTAR